MVNLTVHRKLSNRYANEISENEQVSDYLENPDEKWSTLSLKLHRVADFVPLDDFGKSTILGSNDNFMQPFRDAIETYDIIYDSSEWVTIDDLSSIDEKNPFKLRGNNVMLDPSFSEKIRVRSTEIIIIGDLHSGLQSLVQIIDDLVDREILSDDLKLKHGYHLVFLGDLIDRGGLGLDILHIVFRIKVINFQSTTIINGNHEDVSMYKRGGFGQELENQITNEHDRNIIRSLLTYLPSVVFMYLYDSGEWLQLNHGGIESQYNPKEFMQSDFDFHFHGFDDGGDLVYRGLRWNDFNGNVIGVGPSPRGRSVFEYGKKETEYYLKRNNLTGIIRGHQELTHFMALQRTNGFLYDMERIEEVEMITIPFDHWKNIHETGWETIPIVNVFDDISVVTSSSANRARNLGMNTYLELSNSRNDFSIAQKNMKTRIIVFQDFAKELDFTEELNFLLTARFNQFKELSLEKIDKWRRMISYLKNQQDLDEYEFYNWFILDSYKLFR